MKLKKKFLKLLGKTTVVPIKLRERPAKEGNNLEYADKFALGHELRRAREKSSQDLRDIANLLRIRYEYLKAIEEGDIEALPGSTYMVGFVKTYAKYLGLDPKQSVRIFKSSTRNREPTNITVFPSPAPEGKVPGRVVIFLTILIGAGIFLVWDKSQETTAVAPNHLNIKLENSQNISPEIAAKKPASDEKMPDMFSDKQQKQHVEKRNLLIIKSKESRTPQASEQINKSGTLLPKHNINSVIKKQNSAPALPYNNKQQPEVAALVEKASNKLHALNKKKTPNTISIKGLPRISIEATSNSWVQIQASNSDILYRQILKTGDTYDVPDRNDLFLTTGNIQALILKINGKQISEIESPTRIAKNIALTSKNLFKLSGNN